MSVTLAPDHARSRADDDFSAALIGEAAGLSVYARRLTGSAVDADDLLQDTMLRCWTARVSFQPGTSMTAWTRTVMRNRFLTERRRARFQADLPDDALDRLAGVADGQEQAVELRDAAWALGELTPEHREAVLLASEGVTIEEATTRLSIPEGTYKSRVARGRSRLRELTENRDAHRPARPPAPEPVRAFRPRRRRDWKGVVIG